MKFWSGSRPSTWQNCWLWLAEFSGWISTTSPAAKLCGKATGKSERGCGQGTGGAGEDAGVRGPWMQVSPCCLAYTPPPC